MKIQYLAVIFVVIIMPISLVMSQYIQNQIDTITLQTQYTMALNNATYDSLKAFQINSVNNKYTNISDSKIRDIEASINTFYNSLGTSMDKYTSSREELSIFVPAILFNLYDGYYIYSSYNNVYTTVGTDESERVQIVDNHNYQDGLRPYIYYSCKYILSSGKIIIVNYTLDNAITVYGDFGSGYETRSGYLINPDYVQNVNEATKTLTYNGILIEPEELTEHLLIIEDSETGTISEGDYHYIIYNNQKVYYDNATGQYFWYANYKKTYLQSERSKLEDYINSNGVGFRSISAYEYYKEAKVFSEWVNTNLGDIRQRDVIRMDGTTNPIGSDTTYLSVNTGNEKIFDTSGTNDPMLSSSVFNEHRTAIIRKSMETNLTTAIANYNSQSGSTYEFVMPIIDEENWYSVVNNVSVIAFMQGMPIGQKYYNNYSVITNTKNEEVINEQSIYVLTRDSSSGNLEYHQPGCKTLIDDVNSGSVTIEGVYTDLSFLRQTVKITEANIQYFYPQARVGATTTGCYDCIVNASVDYDIDSIILGEVTNYQTGDVMYDASHLEDVRKAYLTGLARERYDLYRTSNLN